MGYTAEQVDLPGVAGLNEGVFGLVAELGGEDVVGFCGCREGYVSVCSLSIEVEVRIVNGNVPAAEMENGPSIAPSSSWVTKEGCAA